MLRGDNHSLTYEEKEKIDLFLWECLSKFEYRCKEVDKRMRREEQMGLSSVSWFRKWIMKCKRKKTVRILKKWARNWYQRKEELGSYDEEFALPFYGMWVSHFMWDFVWELNFWRLQDTQREIDELREKRKTRRYDI